METLPVLIGVRPAKWKAQQRFKATATEFAVTRGVGNAHVRVVTHVRTGRKIAYCDSLRAAQLCASVLDCILPKVKSERGAEHALDGLPAELMRWVRTIQKEGL